MEDSFTEHDGGSFGFNSLFNQLRSVCNMLISYSSFLPSLVTYNRESVVYEVDGGIDREIYVFL